MQVRSALALGALVLLGGCPGDETGPDVATDDGTLETFDAPDTQVVTAWVRLDGVPLVDANVSQGGVHQRWRTGTDGSVQVPIDRSIVGDIALIASHAEARTEAALVSEHMTELTIDLERFDPSDNLDYVFKDPGDPASATPTVEHCRRCHATIASDFFTSRHSRSGSNPAVHDLYAGTSASLTTQAACEAADGKWWTGVLPGTGQAGERCYLGEGALPTLNADCGDSSPCDGVATAFGGCADCHAPGIDGQLGGRDYLAATGPAFERGVHCDVCHHVESIVPEAAPGVAGRLHIVRPSEPTELPTGTWRPLLFGPHDDVPNPLMGVVQRLDFQESVFCSGCHQLEQEVLVPGATLNSARWPSGKLPIHSTYAEHRAGSVGFTCQGCHMPGSLDDSNGADLYPAQAGIAGGWLRSPGDTRRHAWYGPRSSEPFLRERAASLELTTELVAGELTVTVTTKNDGAGHGLPTGEPMRSVVLLVEAACEGQPLVATGGDAVPDFGGYRAMQVSAGDWTTWPEAAEGDVVRVVERPGGHHDYEGFGPFGDGTFDAAAKNMPIEHVVGQSRVLSVDSGQVTLDTPLPAGDVAYLSVDSPLPGDGEPSVGRAGAPGFAFARVLVGPSGQRMVPHFLAVDVASDNRLAYQLSWTTSHRFQATCDQPQVRAILVHRLYPLDLARQRGWQQTETLLVEATP